MNAVDVRFYEAETMLRNGTGLERRKKNLSRTRHDWSDQTRNTNVLYAVLAIHLATRFGICAFGERTFQSGISVKQTKKKQRIGKHPPLKTATSTSHEQFDTCSSPHLCAVLCAVCLALP